MHFNFALQSDTGNFKQTNQDSALVKHAEYKGREVIMALVCDGMGGLSDGELASATVIRSFNRWFNEEFASFDMDLSSISKRWSQMLKALNEDIRSWGNEKGERLGTTFTGILMGEGKYLIVHIGDCRAYKIDTSLTQLTKDQTFVAREIERGHMTPEQAKTDKRRNMLLQCVGASSVITPQIVYGDITAGVYLLCSDGFRHEISEKEIYDHLKPELLVSREAMEKNEKALIDTVMQRGERDNITVITIKVTE